MRIEQFKCPKCDADLKVPAGADRITCEYCGSTSAVQRRSAIFQVPQRFTVDPTTPIAVAKVSWVGFIWVPALLIGLVVGIISLVRAHGGGVGSSTYMDWDGSGPPALLDVDGDGVDDPIGLVRYVQDGDRMHMAAFSGATGKPLWQSAKLGTYEEVYQGSTVVVGGHALRANQSGTVRAFAAKTGLPEWQAEVGDAVDAWCAGPTPTTVLLMTHDEHTHQLELGTGTRSDAKPLRQARDRDDNHAAWPICVAVPSDVRGTAPGLLVDDDLMHQPKFDGFDTRVVVSRPGGATIVVGTKSPGTSVPTLIAVDGQGNQRWKAVIPAANPNSSRSDEHIIAITDTLVAVTYEVESGGPHLTAFALADGTRLWDTPVPMNTTIVMTGLAVNQRAILLSSWGHLQAFDPATGKRLYKVGEL